MILSFCLSLLAVTPNDRPIEFVRDVRPLLSDHCFSCHGPDGQKRRGQLRLDVPDGLYAAGNPLPIITPGAPEKSELYRRITSENPGQIMPPSYHVKTLTKEEIDVFRQWISQGAKYEDHWSYRPVPQNPRRFDVEELVDRYLKPSRRHSGLPISPPTDPVTLIRRLSFDLLGLPPTPDDVDGFVKDPSPQNYRKIVESYLSSPRHAERMTMHWLDLVRYADTVGYHGDQEHPISPYRDYVIHAFLVNKPFDQFTLEQIAGDLLEVSPDEDSSVGEMRRIASGYNRVLQTTHEGGAQDAEYLAKYAADRVRNVSTVWLGSTMGCAQCHDHKFDPFTLKDFYAFAAFFADIKEKGFFDSPNTSPTKRPPEMDVLSPLDWMKIRELEDRRDDLFRQGAIASRIAPVQRQIRERRAQTRRTMVTESVPPRATRILPRGDWLDDSGDIVQPQIPSHFGTLQPSKGETRLTRLDLARWLVSESNPLTARVFVNRLWQMFFGRGLSAVVDDLGSQGTPPTHRFLHNALAREFIDSGYDVRHMIRSMVYSQAYQLSSVPSDEARLKDPDNQWITHQARFRRPAEMIRDSALSVAGLIHHELGGPSAKPYQPPGYYLHLNFPKRKYQAHDDQQQYRRGVYMHWQRQYLHPMLLAFDAPTREECTAQRVISNTPAAALAGLNDPTFVEAARGFAIRILREGGSTLSSRTGFAIREALHRRAEPEERLALETLYIEHRARWAKRPKEMEAFLSVGLSSLPSDVVPLDVAAMTSVARTLMNLHEFLNRD